MADWPTDRGKALIAVRGFGSAIVTALRPLLPKDEWIVTPERQSEMPVGAERYLFCAGLLRSKPSAEQTAAEIEEGWHVNFRQVRSDCEHILSSNDKARICVIGSESAYRGSYDETYAASKQCLHTYVKRRRLGPDQQLVGISPGVIEDCGQHIRREDEWRIAQRKEAHPKKRFLKAREVARLIHYVLFQDEGYLTSVVIRLNGGEHTA